MLKEKQAFKLVLIFREFRKSIKSSLMLSFRQKVLNIVKNIPRGKTMTYKEVARRAGSEKAYRAVGNVLNKNFNSSIPCHRVIRSDGKLGGYNRGADRKTKLLRREGCKV